ncbi:MAG: tryptophan-rich sensory protein [Clostridiales bacterium]|nr:tryptophan-rich sensory protein [Candidatus Equinaster intestinalis]
MKIKKLPLIIGIIVPLAVGGLSALLTMEGMKSFEIINKPPFSPPRIAFPIVWTILYILMGIASYLVYTARSPEDKKTSALLFYGVQLVFNFFWSIIFFNMEAYLFAFVWLLIMIALIVVTTVKFYKINKWAGYLMIPYIVWCCIAAYLNFGVYLLN